MLLANGRREAERVEEEPDEPVAHDDFQPLHGCTEEDVGWMKVLYNRAQIVGSSQMGSGFDWHREYRRPPKTGFNY